MTDFIKYFFRIKKINFLLTFLSLLNFGIMFGAEEEKKKHKIEIKFEKKDTSEKKPFTIFLENFCQTFDLNIDNINKEDFRESKYDFNFYYRDSDDEDKVIVSTADDFLIFYKNPDCYENVSTTRHLFLEKNEKEGDDIIKAYNEIINKENFKNISITVYINEDLKVNNEEEKKEENIEANNKENKEANNEENNVPYNHIEKKLNGNGDKNNNEDVNKNKNNDCPYCNCCLDCF